MIGIDFSMFSWPTCKLNGDDGTPTSPQKTSGQSIQIEEHALNRQALPSGYSRHSSHHHIRVGPQQQQANAVLFNCIFK